MWNKQTIIRIMSFSSFYNFFKFFTNHWQSTTEKEMSKIGSLHSCSKENFKILFGCSHITLFGGVKSKQSGSFLNRKASIKNDCFYVNWLFSVCLSSGPTRRRCYLNKRFYSHCFGMLSIKNQLWNKKCQTRQYLCLKYDERWLLRKKGDIIFLGEE